MRRGRAVSRSDCEGKLYPLAAGGGRAVAGVPVEPTLDAHSGGGYNALDEPNGLARGFSTGRRCVVGAVAFHCVAGMVIADPGRRGAPLRGTDRNPQLALPLLRVLWHPPRRMDAPEPSPATAVPAGLPQAGSPREPAAPLSPPRRRLSRRTLLKLVGGAAA